MLTILIKLLRKEKFSIRTETKNIMYEMLKYIILASKVEKRKRIELFNIVYSHMAIALRNVYLAKRQFKNYRKFGKVRKFSRKVYWQSRNN